MLEGIQAELRAAREKTNSFSVFPDKANRDRLTQYSHNTSETIRDRMRAILPGQSLHTVAQYAPNTQTIPSDAN